MGLAAVNNFSPDFEEIIKETIKTAVFECLNELQNSEPIKRKVSKKNTFQKTEMLLYNYNNFKASINDMKSLLKTIKNSGYEKQSTSIKTFSENYSFLQDSEFEQMENKIAHIEASIKYVYRYMHMIDGILTSLKDDPYIDIIRLKYFENLSTDEVAARLMCDNSTVNRNKNRLIDAIKTRVFSTETINEIIYG